MGGQALMVKILAQMDRCQFNADWEDATDTHSPFSITITVARGSALSWAASMSNDAFSSHALDRG